MKKILSCLGLCVMASFSLAQAPNMAPPEELKELFWTLGEWSGSMKWDHQGMKADGVMVFKNDLDGQFIRSVNVINLSNMKFTETSYTGFDPKHDRLFAYTFTNFSPKPRIEHATKEGNKWIWLSEPWETGTTIHKSRATMTKKSDSEMGFLLEFFDEGKWVKVCEGTFKKKAAAMGSSKL